MHKKLIIMLLLITFIIPINQPVRAASTNMNSIDYWFTKTDNLIYQSKYNMASHIEIDAEQNRYVLLYDDVNDIDYILKISKIGQLLWYKVFNYSSEVAEINTIFNKMEESQSITSEDYLRLQLYKKRGTLYLFDNKIYYSKNYWVRHNLYGTKYSNTVVSVINSSTGNSITHLAPDVLKYNVFNWYLKNLVLSGQHLYNPITNTYTTSNKIETELINGQNEGMDIYTFNKRFCQVAIYDMHYDNDDDINSTSEFLVTLNNDSINAVKYANKISYDYSPIIDINSIPITPYFFVGHTKDYIINLTAHQTDDEETYYTAELTATDSIKPFFSQDINTQNEMVYCSLTGSNYTVAYTTINAPYTYTVDTYLASDLTARQRAAWTASDKNFVSKKSFILGTTIYSNELDLNTYTYAKAPSATISSSKIAVGDNTNFKISGIAKDLNDSANAVTVEVTINGIIKTMTTVTGAYSITFNSVEVGEGLHDITVVVKDKLGLTKTITQEGMLDIDFTLKDFLNSIDILSNQSQIARVIVLDSDERIIDDNTSNQSIINSIATKVNSKDVGLYIIDNGNKILKDLSSQIK